MQEGFQFASSYRRIGAFAMDFFIAAFLGLVPVMLLEITASGLSDTVYGLITQVIGLTLFLVYALLTTLTRGATVGKSALHLQIISADGNEASDGQIVKRYLVLGLTLAVCSIILPLTPVPPFVPAAALAIVAAPIFVRPDHRSFHDLIAGTAVIFVPPPDAPVEPRL
jgi:uncharacterized RDD family membrane protein YckC